MDEDDYDDSFWRWLMMQEGNLVVGCWDHQKWSLPLIVGTWILLITASDYWLRYQTPWWQLWRGGALPTINSIDHLEARDLRVRSVLLNSQLDILVTDLRHLDSYWCELWSTCGFEKKKLNQSMATLFVHKMCVDKIGSLCKHTHWGHTIDTHTHTEIHWIVDNGSEVQSHIHRNSYTHWN